MIPRSPRALWPAPNLAARRLFSSSNTIREHDVVCIRQQRGDGTTKWHLTAPVRPDSVFSLSWGGRIRGSELIGRKYFDLVKDSRGLDVVPQEPSLASYILLARRIATPIYPHDAATIVSILDLNLPRPGEDADPDDDGDGAPAPPFEVFEAGTGMGSLTLHLARALHAANQPVPPALRQALCTAPRELPGEAGVTPRLALDRDAQRALDAYRASRRAVLHSLDTNPRHTHQALGLVRHFRRALYLPTVDFRSGPVADFTAARLDASAGAPFLAHAVLDLPNAEDHIAPLLPALRDGALLLVFAPSISQVAELAARAAAQPGAPLRLERVLELPQTVVSDGQHEAGGGRPWDVRTFVPRARAGNPDAQPVQVMRPKVGNRVAGGGFLAVMRRWPVGTPPAGCGDAAAEVGSSERDAGIAGALGSAGLVGSSGRDNDSEDDMGSGGSSPFGDGDLL